MVMGRVKSIIKKFVYLSKFGLKMLIYTITKYLQEESKKLGAEIQVTRFVRFERGEGIEKKEENFAEEVQRQVRVNNN